MARRRLGWTARMILVATAACSAGIDAVSAQPVQVGIAAAIVGQVGVRTAAIPNERQVARKQRMAWGDMVRTRRKSLLQILLLDRSNFSIGANTQMTIDKFVYDPTKGRSLVARVITGAFRFMSGRKNPNSSATISSPAGTIGIRGTALDALVGKDARAIAESEASVGKGVGSDDTTATLVVLRGPGEKTEGGLQVGVADVSAAGKTVTLNQPELAAYIPRAGAQPIGPFSISSQGLSKVQDMLSPSEIQATKSNALRNLLGGLVAATAAGAVLSGDDDDDERYEGGEGTHQNPTGESTNPQPGRGTGSIPQ